MSKIFGLKKGFLTGVNNCFFQGPFLLLGISGNDALGICGNEKKKQEVKLLKNSAR